MVKKTVLEEDEKNSHEKFIRFIQMVNAQNQARQNSRPEMLTSPNEPSLSGMPNGAIGSQGGPTFIQYNSYAQPKSSEPKVFSLLSMGLVLIILFLIALVYKLVKYIERQQTLISRSFTKEQVQSRDVEFSVKTRSER